MFFVAPHWETITFGQCDTFFSSFALTKCWKGSLSLCHTAGYHDNRLKPPPSPRSLCLNYHPVNCNFRNCIFVTLKILKQLSSGTTLQNAFVVVNQYGVFFIGRFLESMAADSLYIKSILGLNRFGFFNGHCQYVESMVADGQYVIIISCCCCCNILHLVKNNNVIINQTQNCWTWVNTNKLLWVVTAITMPERWDKGGSRSIVPHTAATLTACRCLQTICD